MARRAKSSLNPLHLAGMLAIVLVVAMAGVALMRGPSDSSYSRSETLSLRDYLDNSNALSDNVYRLEGLVEERLDNWRSSEGRLFSVVVEEGKESAPLPVLVPTKFNSTNVQRGQRFHFKVKVQSTTGVLEVLEMTKA